MDYRSGVGTLTTFVSRVSNKFMTSSLTQFLFWLSIPVIVWMMYQIKCFRDNNPFLYGVFWYISLVLLFLKVALVVIKFLFGAYKREPILSIGPIASDIDADVSEEILDVNEQLALAHGRIKSLEAAVAKYEDEKKLTEHRIEQIGQMKTAMTSDFALVQALAQRIDALTAELNRLRPPTPRLTPANMPNLLGGSPGLIITDGEEFVSEAVRANLPQATENESESARTRFGLGISRNRQTQLENSTREIHYWPANPNAQPHLLCAYENAQASAKAKAKANANSNAANITSNSNRKN